ncbi:hypothetical protein A9Q84_20485 [Halobacteriovorax marinus]|uniref:Lipoprotein n=1 Tax=Halobacteriovorax marinus TaxID=97084 RepID=A0A1Y5F554_9BACT|nr:hypothetical protein A9Q84_20485 [Halobacteriovorax marinus]
MNFNYILILFTIFITACGVKGPPKAPAGTSVPSFITPYMKQSIPITSESNKEEEEEEDKKSSKKN